MSELEGRIFCGNCCHEVHGEPERRVLGFSRYSCSTCGEQVTGPISTFGRRLAWGVALLGLGLADVFLLLQHQMPGLLCLALSPFGLVIVAIDQRIVRRHQTRGRNHWLVQLARRAERFTQAPHTTGG